MDMVYHWRFNRPGKTLHMHIENHQEAKVFDATLRLTRRPLTRDTHFLAVAYSAHDAQDRDGHLLAGAASVA
jgi:DUF1365 family protein